MSRIRKTVTTGVAAVLVAALGFAVTAPAGGTVAKAPSKAILKAIL